MNWGLCCCVVVRGKVVKMMGSYTLQRGIVAVLAEVCVCECLPLYAQVQHHGMDIGCVHSLSIC